MSASTTNSNKLYYGDNLDVLRKFVKDESVDLCYIDPPFNSKKNYNQIYNKVEGEDRAQAQAFIDTWEWDSVAIEGLSQILENEHGRFIPQTIELIKGLRNVLQEGGLLAYLISMTLRIVEIHRELKPTGSFYLHCDPTASHYLKLIMDAVFGPLNFRNEIIWRRTNAHNKLSKQYGPIHDIILFYTKTNNFVFHPGRRPYTKEYIKTSFPHSDSRGRYQSNVLTGAEIRTGDSGRPWRDYNPTYKGRHWAIPGKLSAELGIDVTQYTTQQILELLDQQGLILHPKKLESLPRYKQYLDTSEGVLFQDIWAYQPGTSGILEGSQEGIDEDVKWLDSDEEKLDYPTQKPEALLERIIGTSSNEGDMVLDAYCGCGTTVSVAQNLNRRWIGIDITYQSISLILKRLEDAFGSKAIETIILNGIPKDMDSAIALAHKKDDRVRKEFEKWAVLTYSNNRATINEKKGADRGIDGTAYFMATKTENAKMIFQVKSGNVGEKDIRDLRGAIEQERAQIGIFITLQEPTSRMIKTAHAAGGYHHELMGRDYDKIQIVPVRDMIEKGARLEMPLTRDVVKSAKPQPKAVQLELRSKKDIQLELQPKPVQLELG